MSENAVLKVNLGEEENKDYNVSVTCKCYQCESISIIHFDADFYSADDIDQNGCLVDAYTCNTCNRNNSLIIPLNEKTLDLVLS